MSGTRDLWARFIEDLAEGFSFSAWNETSFDLTEDAFTDEFGSGTLACLELKAEIVYPIDLSSIAIGEEFTVQSIAEADALNKRGGGAIGDHQASGVSAFSRTTVRIAGLEPTNRPDQTPPLQTAITPASCLPGPGPDPAAGVLQFSAASFTTDESPGSLHRRHRHPQRRQPRRRHRHLQHQRRHGDRRRRLHPGKRHRLLRSMATRRRGSLPCRSSLTRSSSRTRR